MAKLLDGKAPARLVPSDQMRRAEGERIAYLLKVPTVYDRAPLARAVAQRGGKRWTKTDMLGAARDGLAMLLPEENDAATRGALEKQLDLYDETLNGFAKAWLAGRWEATDEETLKDLTAAMEKLGTIEAELLPLFDQIAAGYPRLASMIADDRAFPLIFGIEATKLFLLGWENRPESFARGPLGVPDDLLSALPDEHLIAIGGEIDRLRRPTEAERKNSDTPSSGPSAVTSSTAASTPPASNPSETTASSSPNSASTSSESIPAT
jgi:hypothetical protein